MEIRVCGHGQARRLTVKDGWKLIELRSAASSISICLLCCCDQNPAVRRERHSYVPETLRLCCVSGSLDLG